MSGLSGVAGGAVCVVRSDVCGGCPCAAAAGDRGGVSELIDTIKRSKIPIICICNDKYNQKLRSLRNHCLELEFRKPTEPQIATRMQAVCAAERMTINQVRKRGGLTRPPFGSQR